VHKEGDDVAKATYTLALGIVVTAVFMSPDRVDASKQQETSNPAAAVDPTSARVRTEDPVLATLLRDATDRSTTFRRLVEAITATDGVVYVVRGGCPRPLRACLAFWMVVAGPNRILRVIVDDRQVGSEAIVSIAHELQHALEVLSHRSVRTAGEIFGLFRRIGVWREHSFETYAAIRVGDDVRSELRRPRSRQVK
jgi:hypothetical protein